MRSLLPNQAIAQKNKRQANQDLPLYHRYCHAQTQDKGSKFFTLQKKLHPRSCHLGIELKM